MLRHTEGKIEVTDLGHWTRISILGPRGGRRAVIDVACDDLPLLCEALQEKRSISLRSAPAHIGDQSCLAVIGEQIHLLRDYGRGNWAGCTLTEEQALDLGAALQPQPKGDSLVAELVF